MAVINFPTSQPADQKPAEVMVDFTITGGPVALSGRWEINGAIEKIEEALNLLKAHARSR